MHEGEIVEHGTHAELLARLATAQDSLEMQSMNN